MDVQEKSEEPYFFQLESLYRRKNKGITHITCDKSLKDVPIQLLLDLISIEKVRNPANSQVKDWIARGSLERALEELKRLAPEDRQNEAIQLLARYNKLEESINEGVLTEGSSDVLTERSAIRKAALAFCSQLENHSFP